MLAYATGYWASAFDRLRQRRLGSGVLPAWASSELCAGAKLNGNDGCRALVLHRAASTSVVLVHADESNPRVFWHSVAVLTQSGDALLIEHAIGRAAPEGLELAAVATSPAALLALLDRDGVSVTPPELRLGAPVTLGRGSVPAFAKNVLGVQRLVPVTLVAPGEIHGARRDPARRRAPLDSRGGMPSRRFRARRVQRRGRFRIQERGLDCAERACACTSRFRNLETA